MSYPDSHGWGQKGGGLGKLLFRVSSESSRGVSEKGDVSLYGAVGRRNNRTLKERAVRAVGSAGKDSRLRQNNIRFCGAGTTPRAKGTPRQGPIKAGKGNIVCGAGQSPNASTAVEGKG